MSSDYQFEFKVTKLNNLKKKLKFIEWKQQTVYKNELFIEQKMNCCAPLTRFGQVLAVNFITCKELSIS